MPMILDSSTRSDTTPHASIEAPTCEMFLAPVLNRYCGKPAIVRSSGICSCEHIETSDLCARHFARLRAAKVYCTTCRRAGHVCYMEMFAEPVKVRA